ncbi:MAG: DNA repair exonuclease [Armatimonadota bacterium]|nr:DNA repair exonuclease [bacterium]
MAFTFVHAADVHLDCPFDGLGDVPSELALILKNATFVALDNIVELCLSRRVDFLVVSGDVYNSRDKSLRAQLKFRAALERLADAGISSYVVCGNHDPSGGWSASLDWPYAACFFSSTEAESRPVIRQGREIATVHGISYANPAVTENLSRRFARDNGSPFSIAVLHCNCGQSAPHEPYAPCSIADLVDSGFDYWALGHIHKRCVLRDGAPAIVYPGNPQGLNPKETGPKGCYIVNVDDAGCASLEFVETDAVRWFNEEICASSITSEQELIDALGEKVEAIRREARRPALVRFHLTGRTAVHQNLARKGMLDDIAAELRDGEAGRERLVWVESVRDHTMPDVNIDERRKSEDFLGDFLRQMQEARNDSARLAELRIALEPLWGHGRGRAYLDEPTDDQLLEWLDMAQTYGLDALS